MESWTENTIQRMLINPFYAITFTPALTVDHIPPMSEAEWIRTNALSIDDGGAEKWLMQLLEALEGKAAMKDERVNPFNVINIDPKNAIEHPPIVTRELWIQVNTKLIEEMGANEWLKQLLDVLVGDIVTSGNFGLTMPSRSNPLAHQGRGQEKKKRKKNQKK
jgi:hypothetical protein